MNNYVDFPVKEVIPGAGSLVEHIDRRIFVWLRDGRKYVGMLRSVDQFANLVLHNAFERIQIFSEYADIYMGIILVRGENVALLGEVGEEVGNRHIPADLISEQVSKEKKKEKIDDLKVKAYYRRGMIYTPEDFF